MKKALVLAGGGTRGIYQVGAIEALKEIGEDDWSIITGTSVGALNAAMLVQGDFDRMVDMYEHLQADQIVVLDGGRIAGIGTHRELLASCEVYREIARSQLSPDELELQGGAR